MREPIYALADPGAASYPSDSISIQTFPHLILNASELEGIYPVSPWVMDSLLHLGLFGLRVSWNLYESGSHLEWVMGSGFTRLNPPSLAGGGGDQPPTMEGGGYTSHLGFQGVPVSLGQA